MSLHELLELDEGLRGVVGRGLDLVVVNAVYPDRFTGAEAEQLRPLEAQHGDIHAALEQHDRALIHAARVEWLRERVDAPVVTLPFLFTTDIGAREHDWLAEELVP
jgi:hypothetical protein